MTTMIELIYTSKTQDDMKASQLYEILSQARIYNQKHDITGILCYDKSRFLQVLEGPARDVTALYEKIKTDPRHEEVELIHQGQIETKAFQTWSMAFQHIPQALLELLNDTATESSNINNGITNFSHQITHAKDSKNQFGQYLASILIQSLYTLGNMETDLLDT